MPNRIGVDPETGRFTLDGQVLDRNDPRLWGNAGRFLWGGNEQGMDNENSTQMSDDPRYFQRVGSRNIGGGDSGEQTQDIYGLRPEVAQRLNGRVQISQSGIGGWNEVIDPSKVEYDEEFGFVTDPHNIKRGDPQDDRQAMITAFAIPAAIAGGVAMAHSAAVGGFSGAGATEAGPGTAQIPGDLPYNTGTTGSGVPLDPTPDITVPGAPAGPTTGAPTAGAPAAGVPAGSPGAATIPADIVPGGTVTPSPALVDPPPIIGSANPNLFSRVGDWYGNLSPMSRTILGLGVSQAASAALAARAQHNAQDFQQQQIDQQNADRIRRGSLPAFGGAFRPKNPATPKSTVGIIDSRRRG